LEHLAVRAALAALATLATEIHRREAAADRQDDRDDRQCDPHNDFAFASGVRVPKRPSRSDVRAANVWMRRFTLELSARPPQRTARIENCPPSRRPALWARRFH
jgi:hypothetical protein